MAMGGAIEYRRPFQMQLAPVRAHSHAEAARTASMPGMLSMKAPQPVSALSARGALATGTSNFVRQGHGTHIHMPVQAQHFRSQDNLLATPHAGMNMGNVHTTPTALLTQPVGGFAAGPAAVHVAPTYAAPSLSPGTTLAGYHNSVERQASLQASGHALWQRAHTKVMAVGAMQHSVSQPAFQIGPMGSRR